MSIRIRRHATGLNPERVLLDTSVVIALDVVEFEQLPVGVVISSVTFAELASGPPAAARNCKRRRRLDRLRSAESTLSSLVFDLDCARAYGRVYAAVLGVGRKPRGPRIPDLMIAATALAHGLPLYTLNARDLRGLEGLVEVVDLAQYG